MTESYVKVVLYQLNCDHPNHDRKAFAQLDGTDPESAEYHSDDWETLIQAREAAARSGWIVRNGKAICPRCAAAE